MSEPPPLDDDRPAAALLTARGRGAVATIQYEGDVRRMDEADRPLFRAANGRPLAAQSLGRIVFGGWGDDPVEEIVVCRTAPRTLEIHCHGGEAAFRRILEDLASVGCGRLTWQEITERTTGRFDAECLEALTRATTRRTAEILLEQSSGLLRRTLDQCRSMIQRDGITAGTKDTLQTLLAWAEFGIHLTQPWQVVLSGRPNVGKSSLINALLGYTRSIVFDQPGTTRDVVTAETAFDGWPVQLADTAGLRCTAEELEEAGIERARRRWATADCRVLLLDMSQPAHADDLTMLADWPDAQVVAHKMDLPQVWSEPLPPHVLPVSSRTGAGIDALIAAIVGRLVPHVPSPGTPLPITQRQVTHLDGACAAIECGDAVATEQALNAIL